jgi:hypothetical protein
LPHTLPDAEMETLQRREMSELADDTWLDPRATQTILQGGTAYAVEPATIPEHAGLAVNLL